MKRVNWTQVGVVVVIVLLVFLIGVSLLGGMGRYGMMGRGGMMSGWPLTCWSARASGPGMGGWGVPMLGGLGMLFMWIVPLGLLALLVAGIVWLVRSVAGPRTAANPQAPIVAETCSNCGRPTQTGWQLCPYCGQSLS